MATKLDTQHFMLLLKRFVPVYTAPLPYRFNKAIEARAHGLLLDDPLSFTRLRPEIPKTKEIKGTVVL